MKIKSIKKIKLDKPIPMYDITVENYHNFSIGNGIITHNSSLQKAINKLAKPFSCSRKMLLGDGFFGSPVNPKPASSRYTKIKSDPKTKELISKYSAINRRNSEGNYDWINVDLPVSLCTHIVGIAVGYRSNILPRKMEDVEAYLEGSNKKLAPYFMNFEGSVKKYLDRDRGWIIEGVFSANDDTMTMNIGDLPPLVKYTSFINKLNVKLEKHGGHCKIANNSKKTVDIQIKWKNRMTWEDVKVDVEKLTKVAVIEQLIFVKNGNVVEYDSVHDYLDEFRVHRERVIHTKMMYDLRVYNGELEFLKAKRDFLIYMMEKKRTASEIKKFIGKYNHMIKKRLDAIKLTALSPETVNVVEKQIADMIKQIAEQEKTNATQLKKCVALEKDFKSKGKVSLSRATVLFEDENPYQLDGIEVFDEEDAIDPEDLYNEEDVEDDDEYDN